MRGWDAGEVSDWTGGRQASGTGRRGRALQCLLGEPDIYLTLISIKQTYNTVLRVVM